MRLAMYMPSLQPGSVSWTIYQDLATAVRQLGHEFEVWTDPCDEASNSLGTVFLDERGSLGLDEPLAPFLRSQRLLSTARMLAAQMRASRT